jgi:hypothetical protein
VLIQMQATILASLRVRGSVARITACALRIARERASARGCGFVPRATTFGCILRLGGGGSRLCLDV